MRRPYDPKPAPGAAPDPALLQAVALLSFYGAVADQFRRQNPDLQLAFIPAVTSSTGPGKRPHPKLGDWTGGEGLPFDRRLWNDPAVNGYGIVLSGSPDILVVDVDKAEALNPQAAALLEAWPGLTYATANGRHYICHHPGPALTLDKTFGQVWRNEKRFVALTGSEGKKFPEQGNYRIGEAPAWITELLTELEAHPDRLREQTGRQNGQPTTGYNPQVLKIVRDMHNQGWNYPDIKTYIQNTPEYADALTRYRAGDRTHPDTDIRRIYEDWTKKTKTEPPPPEDHIPEDLYDQETRKQPPPEVKHTLGDLTLHGQQILEDKLCVGYVGQWQTKQSYIDRGGQNYPAFIRFYDKWVKIAVPPKVKAQGLKQVNEYLNNLPDPLQVGNRHLYIPPPGEYALIRGQQQQGKSWIALHILKQLGLPALYVDTERPGVTMERAKHFGITEQTLIHSTPSYKDLQQLADNPHRIVVVDAIAGMIPEENKASAIDDLLRTIQPVTAGKHLILVAHLNKQGDSTRGTGRIEQLASYIYEVEEEEHPKSGRLIKVAAVKASDHRNRPRGLHVRYETIDGHVTWQPADPPGKQQRADKHTAALVAAWKAADPRNLLTTGQPELPSVAAVARMLEHTGYAKAKKARAMTEAAIGTVFKKEPDRGYKGIHPGLDLTDKTATNFG